MSSWALHRSFVIAALLFALCPSSFPQTGNQPSDEHSILVESLVVSGTQSITSAELAELTGHLVGSKFNDDPDELKERIVAQFQDRGFMTAEIQKFDVKVIDPLARPKSVKLEAQVTEGPRCVLSAIDFTGNHAISSETLRAKFPIKPGAEFRRSKIAGGLEKMREVYGSRGFLEAIFIPDVNLDSSSTVKLNIEVREGPQYRMDKLEIIGLPETADKLLVRWELQPGKIFDAGYVATFLDKVRLLLPADFTQENGLQLFTDCKDGTVSVHLHLTADAQHAALDRAKHVECSSAESSAESSQK